ncbi:MAG: N-acetylmuramoyl-L-alanine amidase [candidate division SR1 bacterium]|nr:N-acetylmuramoyl-L-alanine amidase [candidate division SR1 bacterium]
MYKKIFLGMLLIGLARGSTMAADRSLPGITIITRAQWGANESLRYSTLSKTQRDKISQQQADTQLQLLRDSQGEGVDSKLWDTLQQTYELQLANDYLITQFPTEQSVDEVRESANGKFLKWPETIHNNKTKIVIHHTAEDYSRLLTGGISAVKTTIQNIYKYHTITKGRGDIGYNFLIDPAGNIYEGRAGGPGVIGAHAAWNNTSTVGIALMGNFNIQKPTDEQLLALVKLATALAKKYKIDPTAKVSYFKPSAWPPYIATVTSYAVAGHKDDGQATACPGVEMYKLLPDIRQQIKNGLANVDLLSQLSGGAATQVFTGLHYGGVDTIAFSLPIELPAVTSCTSMTSGLLVTSCVLKQGIFTLSLKRTNYTPGINRTIKIVYPSAQGKTENKFISFPLIRKTDLSQVGKDLENTYIKDKKLSLSTSSVTKITHKTFLPELKGYLSGMMNVLLYDLTMNYPRWEITCDGTCLLALDKTVVKQKSVILESSDNVLYVSSGENYLTPTQVSISSSSGGLVKVTSYNRSSYGAVPWNTFHGSLIFKSNPIKNLSSGGVIDTRYVIINRLAFSDYMKGIAETSDTDSLVKQTLVLLLAKMYALFYMNPANIHPSIPAGANYTAIDNPDMYQKYVGAGREKTSKTSATALASLGNTVVLYSGYVPILPYFSCSAGFTRSAKDRRGWIDTPYLQARMDFVPCFDFKGHGVGLSGKGSQYLAEQGWDLKKILEYYYPGVVLTKI